MRQELYENDENLEIWQDGEVNCTHLAENTAWALNRDEWLDDETHWIWDMAVGEASRAERLVRIAG